MRAAFVGALLLFSHGCNGGALISELDVSEPQLRTPMDVALKADREASFSVLEGTLPFGLELEPEGRLHGTPIAVQHRRFTVLAKTEEGDLEERVFDWTVTDPRGMRLLVEELPAVGRGEPFEHALSVVGGTATAWRIVKARTFVASAGDPTSSMLPNTDDKPEWLSLDPSTGVLSGTADDKDQVALLWIEAKGEDVAQEVYALRVGVAEQGWRLTKSEGYVSRFFEAHIPSGLHLALEEAKCFSHYGDSQAWSGTAVGGLAYRAAMLKTDESRAKVKVLLDGLRTLRQITGVPGLPGRAFEHRENIDGDCGQWHLTPDSHEHHHVGTGEFEDYRFWADTSRDQFAGNMWGHGVVHEVLPQQPELRSQAAENLVALASHVWDNEMKIMDLDGKVSRFGMMSGWGFDGLDPYVQGTEIENGVNAVLVLAWFQLASQVASQPEVAAAFEERLAHMIAPIPNPTPGRSFEMNYLSLLDKSYAYSQWPTGLANYFRDTSWYNVHMSFSGFFHLVRGTTNPDVRMKALQAWTTALWQDAEDLESGCDKPSARRARREFNPHYSWLYLAALGDRDPEVIFESLSHLMWFTEPPRSTYALSNPLALPTWQEHPEWTCEVPPIHLRPISSNYIWHREPYTHSGEAQNPDNEDGGIDGFVPYWMGRYFGFVPSNI